jgi:hypothetical protein
MAVIHNKVCFYLAFGGSQDLTESAPMNNASPEVISKAKLSKVAIKEPKF